MHGDPPPAVRDEQLADHLGDYRAWLHTVAYGLLPAGHPDHDDLVQEGYIAMWRALDRVELDRNPSAFLRSTARYRMLSVVAGKRLTGAAADRAAHGTTAGEATRDRIRGYLRRHPAATSRQVAGGLGLSEATISYQRKRLTGTSDRQPATSLDALLEEGLDPADVAASLDDVALAYHYGQIAEAVAALPDAQRRYVVLRFWGGYTHSELTVVYGYPPQGVWRAARTALAGALAHLATAS